MCRKFKGLFILLAILCVSVVAGGSAYFYFGGEESEERSIDNNVEPSGDNNTGITADNILENYKFGSKTDLNETYTYYFFPSTLYMELYKKGQNPETVFGYNEVVLDDSGDPAFTSDGQPMYNIVTENRVGVKENDTYYYTYYDYLVNSLNNKSNYYLSNGDTASRDYPITTRLLDNDRDTNNVRVGHDFFVDPYVINNPSLIDYIKTEDSAIKSSYYSDYNASGEYGPLSRTKYYYFYNIYGKSSASVEFDYHWDVTWSANNITEVYNSISDKSERVLMNFSKSFEVLSPKADKSANDIYGINRKLDETSAKTYIDSEVDKTLDPNKYREQMVEKAQYRNDRFGFWAPFYDWDDKNNADSTLKTEYSASRYLPIKITVNGNLTPDDMAKIIPTVESSMFDSHLYFDFTANGWTYARKNEDGINDEFEYQKAVGGFTLTIIYDETSKSLEVTYDDGEYLFEGTLTDFVPAESEETPETPTYIGTWTGKIGQNTVTLVLNDDGTGSYGDALFTYVDNGEKIVATEVSGFTAKDLNYIFDIMQNPSKYASVENGENVIRLFPVFSNGKNYKNNKNDFVPAANGAGDALRANFLYTDDAKSTIKNDALVKETKLNYDSLEYTYTYTNDGQSVSYNVNYGVLKTVELKKDKYEEISFSIEPASEPSGNWQGNWIKTHVLTGSAIDSFISKYGEGLYTFYYIIGNRMKSNNLGSSLSSIGWNSNLISFLTNNTDPKNNLRNKTLLTINQPTGESAINVNKGDSYKFAHNDYPNIIIGERSRPVVLAVEKVTNLRLVTDIPIKEDDSGKPTDNQDWDAIDKNIEQGLNNAQNAIIADEVYAISSYTNEISDTDLTESNRLDDDNPYIYLIQNADFRFVNNLYFQIRYSNDYISGGMNVRTVYPDDAADVPKYVAYKANGQIMKFFYQNSNEGIFIDNVGPIKGEGTVVDDNDQEKKIPIERSGFKLTNYNARGIYDILLVSTGFNVSTGTQSFDMYINRHKNNFIKLFNRNPGVFDYQVNVGGTDENDKFVSHKLPTEIEAGEESQVRDDTSSLIWNGQTYLGEYLATSTTGTGYGDKVDKVEKVFSENETFIDSIKRTLGVTPGKDTIYPIIDAVTNKTIAYYNAGIGRLFTAYGSTDGLNGNNLDLFTTMKNYVLYIGDPIKSSL